MKFFMNVRVFRKIGGFLRVVEIVVLIKIILVFWVIVVEVLCVGLRRRYVYRVGE